MSLVMLGQIFGIFSFIIGIYAFTHKNDRHLKMTMAMLFLCQTIHFLLLGSMTGMVTNLISCIRTIVAIRYSGRAVGVAFIVGNLVLGIPNIGEWVDVLPILAASIGTFAIFFLSAITMRIAFMCGAILWLVNNWYIGSVGGVLLEAMVLIVNLITIYRLKKTHINEIKVP